MAEDFYTMLAKIQQQYPAALAILSRPGVMAVYAQAVTEGWSGDRLDAALEQTEWWRTTPAPVRQFQALQATDPATASEKATMVRRQIDDIERQTGVKLDETGGLSSPAFQFLAQAVQYGWDAQEIKYRILASVHGDFAGGGELGKTMSDVKKMADEYGVPMSDFSVGLYARRLAEGALDQDGMQGYLIEQAKSLFPGLTAALDKGITVKQYATPYLELAQQELGVNPADISLTDQKWMRPLNQVDPTSGERVSMSLDDWLRTIRSDSSYGYDGTEKARNDATQLTTALAQKLGAI